MEIENGYRERPAWADSLDDREWMQVRHALNYAANWASAGAPGHGQFLLISKLAHKLFFLEDQIGPNIEKPE